MAENFPDDSEVASPRPAPPREPAPDRPPDSRRVAVLGLGRMGAPIARSLQLAGHDVLGFDPAASEFSDVRRAPSELEAVRGVDVVVTVLPGSPELRELMLGRPALLAALSPSCVWIDCTSTAPDVSRELIAAARAAGVGAVDCGLGGGPQVAHERRLTLYVGGEPEAVATARPVLEALSGPGRVHHVGGPGTGVLAKLLVNLLWFGQAALAGEALLLAGAAGLSPDRLAALLPHSAAASRFVDRDLPRLFGGDLLASFGLDRVVEELDGLQRLARATRTSAPVSAAVAALHRDALARFGPADGELLALAHLEELAGRRIVDDTG